MSEDALWTPDDCARYLGIARWTFVNRVSKMPTFPRPHVQLSRRMKRWQAEDVREWTHRTGRNAA